MSETIRRIYRFFEHRPSAVTLVCLVTGIYSAGAGSRYAAFLSALLLIGLIVSLILRKRAYALIAAGILLGLALGLFAMLPELTAPKIPQPERYRAQVCAVSDGNVTLRRLSTDSSAVRGKARASFETEKTLHVGDTVELRAVLVLPEAKERRSLRSKGIYWIAEDEELLRVTKPEWNTPIAVVDRLRQRTDERIAALFPKSAALMQALLTGRDEAMEFEQVKALRTAGIAHLTVASGLHMAVVTAAAAWLLDKMRLLRWMRFLGTVLCAFGYCLFTGLTPSMARAAGMLCLAMTAKLIGRRTDGFNLLCLTASGMLLLWPMDLYSVSFQLSVCAVAGLVGLQEPVAQVFGFLPEKWANTLSAPLAAQLGTLPISLYWFDEISVFSWPVNLLAVPLAGFLLVMGLIGLVLGVLPFASSLLTVRLTDTLAKGLMGGAGRVASVPHATVAVASGHFMLCLLIGVTLLFFAGAMQVPKRIKRVDEEEWEETEEPDTEGESL